MTTDFLLIGGLVVALFSLPFIMAQYSEGRRPWRPFLIGLLGAGAAGAALYLAPEPYSLAALPDVALRVVAQLLP